MKKKLLLTFLMLSVYFINQTVKAQDPHFSQYFTSPMTLNPALTGKGIADWRATATFRSQWWGSGGVSPFYTTAASIEKKIKTGKSGKSAFGISVSMLTDASNAGLLKNNYFTLGAAYNITLDANGDELLGVGIQGTYANRLTDASKFIFQSQFGSMGFQRSIPSGDPVNILSSNYFDVNVGAHYSKTIPKNRWGYQFGLAIFHAGNPEDGTYSSTKYTIARRISLQGGVSFYLRNKDEVHLSSISETQGENNVFTFGGVYKAQIKDSFIEGLHLGIWNRFKDAIYPYVGIEGNNWLIGISYDVLLVNSDIRNYYNNVQSMDFSLVWHFNSKKTSGTKSDRVFIY